MIDLEKQIFKQIEKANKILILFSNKNDGDALSASLALFNFLESLYKKVDIVGIKNNNNHDNGNSNLAFLPNFKKIAETLNNLRKFIVSLDIKNAKISQIKYSVEEDKLNFIISPSSGWFSAEDVSSRAGEFKYDLIITIAVPELESLGAIYDNNIEFFYKTTIINIDNSAANEDFGQINFIDLNSVTNSEIVYYLLKNYQSVKLSEGVATCILAGIIKKTKNFRSGKLSPRTLLASSELIDLGAKREDIINNLFYSKNINSLKIWGEILNNIQSIYDGGFLWSTINLETINHSHIDNDILEDIVDELISSLPEAQVFVLLVKNKEEINIKAFSLKKVDCLNLLKNYNAKGNKFLAEAKTKNEESSEKEIINNLKTLFNNTGS